MEVIIPDASDGKIIIIPEFTLRFGAVGCDGRIARVDRIGFAKFVEEVRETYFDEDIVFFDVFLEFVFVLDDGVFEGDTIRADEIRINNKIVFSVHVANGHLLVPDFVGIRGLFGRHAKSYGGNNYYDDGDNATDSKKFFHFSPFSPSWLLLLSWRDIFH